VNVPPELDPLYEDDVAALQHAFTLVVLRFSRIARHNVTTDFDPH
jgi:hypothetical protein